WISRCSKGLNRYYRRSGMMPMGGAGDGIKAVDDDIGLEITDYPHYIGEKLVPVPVVQGFIRVFTKTKVDGAGKKLPASIGFPGFEQLLCPDHSQFQAKFLPDKVLSPIAPCKGKIGHLGMLV